MIDTILGHTKDEMESIRQRTAWLKERVGYAQEETGNLYFIGDKRGGPVKIGFTTAPEARIKALQSGFPTKLHTHLIVSPCIQEEETAVHKVFSTYRTHGEWFNGHPVWAFISAVRRRASPRRDLRTHADVHRREYYSILEAYLAGRYDFDVDANARTLEKKRERAKKRRRTENGLPSLCCDMGKRFLRYRINAYNSGITHEGWYLILCDDNDIHSPQPVYACFCPFCGARLAECDTTDRPTSNRVESASYDTRHIPKGPDYFEPSEHSFEPSRKGVIVALEKAYDDRDRALQFAEEAKQLALDRECAYWRLEKRLEEAYGSPDIRIEAKEDS